MAHDALIDTGKYRARLAAGRADQARSLALRARVFRGNARADDSDDYDVRCRHMLIEDAGTGRLVASYRLFDITQPRDIGASYSAQFYRLDALEGYGGPMIEVGRFCIAPEARDADVLRVAWAALTRIVDDEGIAMLFGCSSFPGTEPEPFVEAFGLLGVRHLAPARWRPGVKAAEVFRFSTRPPDAPALKRAVKTMPPILRTYLAMGGWVSDHAVVDRDLGTLHVFTGLEVGAVPQARARALRGLVGA